MQVNKELDYNTVYNVRAEEVARMIILNFGEEIKFLSKEEVLPDRPDRDNIVGVILKFKLYENVILNCSMSTGSNITFEKEGKIYSEVKYMTWDKVKSLAFKNDDNTILEKIKIVDKAIGMLEKGEELRKVDVKNNRGGEMERIDNVIEKLATLNHFRTGTGISEEVIEHAEKKLKIVFSPQYRYFLKKYGDISGDGYEIKGLFTDEFNAEDVVGFTLDFRYFDGFTDKLVLFENLDEEFVSFDYEQINAEGEPKIVYNTITCIVENAAEDFASYLEEKYQEMLDL